MADMGFIEEHLFSHVRRGWVGGNGDSRD